MYWGPTSIVRKVQGTEGVKAKQLNSGALPPLPIDQGAVGSLASGCISSEP